MHFKTSDDFNAFRKSAGTKRHKSQAKRSRPKKYNPAPEWFLKRIMRYAYGGKSASSHQKELSRLLEDPQLWSENQEHFEQVFVFAYVEKHHPDAYELFFAVPNGGKQYGMQGWLMVAEGLASGIPDMALDCPQGAYHGLRIELKATVNPSSVSPSQKRKLSLLQAKHYCALLAVGCEQAISLIESYLQLPQFDGVSTLGSPGQIGNVYEFVKCTEKTPDSD